MQTFDPNLQDLFKKMVKNDLKIIKQQSQCDFNPSLV